MYGTLVTKGLLFAFALVSSAGIATAQDAAQKCSVCHAIAGKGGKANPLDGVGAKLSADDTKQWITHPVEAAAKAKSTKKPPMPAKYGSLPAADLDALVAYMQSLK